MSDQDYIVNKLMGLQDWLSTVLLIGTSLLISGALLLGGSGHELSFITQIFSAFSLAGLAQLLFCSSQFRLVFTKPAIGIICYSLPREITLQRQEPLII